MTQTQEIQFWEIDKEGNKLKGIHSFIKKAMYINKFKYFTFTYLDTPLEQVKKYILERWRGDDKYRITYTPFQFDLYDSSPPKGGAHLEKFYFSLPSHVKVNV